MLAPHCHGSDFGNHVSASPELGNVEASKLAGESYEHTMNSAPASAKSAGYTMEEVAKHTKKGDVWVVLHGRVCSTCPISFPSTPAATWRF